MTITEFDSTGFTGGMKGKYDGDIYPIAMVDFAERLIGLIMDIPGSDPDDISWKRCENVELIP